MLDHIAPLMRLIETWRSEGLELPNPDPRDGGINAKALVLLETPGPKAVRTTFVSRDNPDQTARNIGTALSNAGIARADSLIWNVVPYYVSSADKNKNASLKQAKGAARYTQQFIDALSDLMAVILCGDVALRALKFLDIRCRVFATYHPSARVFNSPEHREHILTTFLKVKKHIGA